VVVTKTDHSLENKKLCGAFAFYMLKKETGKGYKR